MARDAPVPQSPELSRLIQALAKAPEGHQHTIMWKMAYLETPEAMRHLCGIVEDKRNPLPHRQNALAPLGPRVSGYKDIEAMLFRLLDDPKLGGAAASYLIRFGNNDMLMKLDKRWAEDEPPAWASAAAAALLPRMGDGEIASRFQRRIEHSSLRFSGLGGCQWSDMPESYRERLLSFVAKRPLDTRDLVYAAAKSGALTGRQACIDHVCDKLAYKTPGMWAYGWDELQLLKRFLKKHPELKPSPDDEATARKIAGVSDRHPVLLNQKRWFVLMDDGHPAADGRFRITIIDAVSKKILKTIGAEGGRISLSCTG